MYKKTKEIFFNVDNYPFVLDNNYFYDIKRITLIYLTFVILHETLKEYYIPSLN